MFDSLRQDLGHHPGPEERHGEPEETEQGKVASGHFRHGFLSIAPGEAPRRLDRPLRSRGGNAGEAYAAAPAAPSWSEIMPGRQPSSARLDMYCSGVGSIPRPRMIVSR